MIKHQIPIQICRNDEEFRANEYLCELWQYWQDGLPTEPDLLEAFPKEYKALLKEKLKELKIKLGDLLHNERQLKNQMFRAGKDESKWIEMAIGTIQKEKQSIDKEIIRIKWFVDPVKSEGKDINRAKEFPIDQIMDFNRQHKAACLWHQDKHPSMQYYKSTNKVWCFVCNKGGDSIDVAMKLWNLDIKETIIKLN